MFSYCFLFVCLFVNRSFYWILNIKLPGQNQSSYIYSCRLRVETTQAEWIDNKNRKGGKQYNSVNVYLRNKKILEQCAFLTLKLIESVVVNHILDFIIYYV